MKETLKNLAIALNKAMKEIKGIEKDMQVGKQGHGGYKGISDYEVKKTFKPIFEKHGLMVLPIDVDAQTKISRWEETYNGNVKQKQSIFTEVKTKYLLLHTSGESIEIAGYGHGIDPQDKGAGKATTYALKYALIYLTMTPIGVIDDTDNEHSNDKEVPKTTQKVEKPKGKLLTKDIFDKAIKSDKIESIKILLRDYSMNFMQRTALEKHLKELEQK